MNNLKQLRERVHYSQQKLAEAMEVTQQAIAKWENGTSMPTADKFPKLAQVLGCSIDDLFKM